MPQICDMGPTALLPLRRKACWGFFRRLRPGVNPRTWVLKGSTLPLDHRSHLYWSLRGIWRRGHCSFLACSLTDTATGGYQYQQKRYQIKCRLAGRILCCHSEFVTYRILTVRLVVSRHGEVSAPVNMDCVCLTLIIILLSFFEPSLHLFPSVAATEIW